MRVSNQAAGPHGFQGHSCKRMLSMLMQLQSSFSALQDGSLAAALQNMYGQPLPYGSMPVAPPGMHYGYPPHHAAVRAVTSSRHPGLKPAAHTPSAAERHCQVMASAAGGRAVCAGLCTAESSYPSAGSAIGWRKSHNVGSQLCQ